MTTFRRKSGEEFSAKKVKMDPRCWRTIYRVRLLLMTELGFMPSFDYALSEILVDPDEGARLLRAAENKYADLPCPTVHGPQGNRHGSANDPNKKRKAGKNEDDWGLVR